MTRSTTNEQDATFDQDDVLELRDLSGEAPDGPGDARDHAGDARDHAGTRRDDDADERDRAAEAFEAQHGSRSTDEFRRSALARRDAAADRGSASEDRANAHADRDASARDRQDASVDALTGVSCRGAGFLGLDREIARARRAEQALVVGFVDVDHLKAVNDGQSHGAGDQMLARVADTLRANLRAYDLIFRYGGDEFVCVLSAVDAAFGISRISAVNRELALGPAPASVTAGFSELRGEDSSTDLVARADAALRGERHHRRSGR